MTRKQSNWIWALSALFTFSFCACDFSPDAALGKDKAADDNAQQANEIPCAVMTSQFTAGTGACADPLVSGVVGITSGDQGALDFLLFPLSDGNFPTIT